MTIKQIDLSTGQETTLPQPSPDHTWDGGAWIAPDPADILAKERASAVVDAETMVRGLVSVAVISHEEAFNWRAGNTLPAIANDLIAGMSDDDALNSKLELLRLSFSRNHPLVAALAKEANLTDAQVDALFGIAP